MLEVVNRLVQNEMMFTRELEKEILNSLLEGMTLLKYREYTLELILSILSRILHFLAVGRSSRRNLPESMQVEKNTTMKKSKSDDDKEEEEEEDMLEAVIRQVFDVVYKGAQYDNIVSYVLGIWEEYHDYRK